MSQLIWMIDLIPDRFWTLVLWTGLLALTASYFLGKIPFVTQYRIPLRVGGVMAVLVGIYFYGVTANEAKWQARVKELEQQVKVAEEAAEDSNKQLTTALEEKKKLASQKQKEVVKYIDRWKTKEVFKDVPVEGPERVRIEEVIKYIEDCKIPKEMIDIHNKGAENPNKGVKK